MQRYRVCVADDHEETASVLCEGLKLHGYEAFSVYSGSAALEACRAGEADLLLLDVCFPDISGYQVCEQLKADRKTQDIPVVFVTVKGGKEDIAKGYQLGAADYITKPYNLPMVMLRVDAAMSGRSAVARGGEGGGYLSDTAYTDHLTGLRNRRFLLERLQEEVEEAHRYDYPVSCVVFDLEEVKALDTELGPVSLDDLLVELAMSLRNHSRTFDVLARYDGTVFATVLPHAPLEHAIRYVGKIMDDVDATTFSDPSFPTEVRLNAGVVTCQNGSALGADYVLGEAMRGLLQAKSIPDKRYVAHNLSQQQ
ncbi:MAG: diguanylate cyclase [Candidatus Hydrogenedentes bacterium]|nr:diguanylate cyclase [Candidatus Hydrogenedentota bacterium]